ncbi:unnamed protein product [Brassica oleracea]
MTFLKSASIDELNAVFREITAVLLPDGSMTGGPKIATVNGVWIEKSGGFSPSCKDLLVNFFKAEYAQVDFQSKAEYTKAQCLYIKPCSLTCKVSLRRTQPQVISFSKYEKSEIYLQNEIYKEFFCKVHFWNE